MTHGGTEPTPEPEGLSRRRALAALGGVLGWALAAGGAGLWLLLSDTAPRAGLTLFYAAAPISALFGVMAGGLPIAWPLDLTLWVVVGTFLARLAPGPRRLWPAILAVVGISLVLALGLGLLVTTDPSWVEG